MLCTCIKRESKDVILKKDNPFVFSTRGDYHWWSPLPVPVTCLLVPFLSCEHALSVCCIVLLGLVFKGEVTPPSHVKHVCPYHMKLMTLCFLISVQRDSMVPYRVR